MNKIIYEKLNDKYYKNYKTLFIYTFLKFNYINKVLLYNFIWKYINNNYMICNYNFDNNNFYKKYNEFLFKTINNKNVIKENYQYNIVNYHDKNNNTYYVIF